MAEPRFSWQLLIARVVVMRLPSYIGIADESHQQGKLGRVLGQSLEREEKIQARMKRRGRDSWYVKMKVTALKLLLG